MHFSKKHGIINQTCKRRIEKDKTPFRAKEVICLLSVHGGAVQKKKCFVCAYRVIHFPFVVIPLDGTA